MKTTRRAIGIALAIAVLMTTSTLAATDINLEIWINGTFPILQVPNPYPPVGGLNDEQETLRRWPAFGYAAFATDDIEIKGNNVSVTGAIRANDNVTIKGKHFYASGGTIDKKKKGGSTKLLTPVMNWSEMQRRATRSYRGNVTMDSRTVLSGVTTVDGDLKIDGWVQGSGIVVVRGNVEIGKHGAGAAGALLIWADGDVRIPKSNTSVQASIITSRDISISGANVRVTGNLIGRKITLSGNNITITTSTAAMRYFPR